MKAARPVWRGEINEYQSHHPLCENQAKLTGPAHSRKRRPKVKHHDEGRLGVLEKLRHWDPVLGFRPLGRDIDHDLQAELQEQLHDHNGHPDRRFRFVPAVVSGVGARKPPRLENRGSEITAPKRTSALTHPIDSTSLCGSITMKRTEDITMAMNSAMMLWFASDILVGRRFTVVLFGAIE
jgi:hypothetical protein